MPAKKSGTRTRRRRARKSRTAVAVEDSSSDSSSSSSSESEFESKTEAAAVKKPSAGVKLVASSSFNSSSSSSLSSSGTDLNSDNEPSTPARAANSARPRCAASPEPVYDDVAVLDRIVRSPVGLYTNDRLGCLSHIPHKTLAGSSTGSGPRPMPAAVHAEAERRRRQARRARSNFIGVLAAQEEGGEEEKKERRRLIGGMNGEGEKRERQKQKQKRQAFEALWLRAVTTEFGDELDSLRRREPNLTIPGPYSRLPLLIDALSAGVENFSQGGAGADDIDEVALVLKAAQQDAEAPSEAQAADAMDEE